MARPCVFVGSSSEGLEVARAVQFQLADVATRKLLRALAVVWDVSPAEAEGDFTEQAARDLNSAEAFFDSGGEGIRHNDVLKEYGLE